MADTIAFQKRITQVGSLGGAEYVVETYIADRGELPDHGAFLLEILDADDPTFDTLARVATVADLSTYVTDRVVAVRNGDQFFRCGVTTVTYTDLNVAQTAVAVLEDFINRLVVAIQQFNSSFSTVGLPGPPADYEELTFPLVSDAIEARLIADYTVKKQAVADGEAAVEAKAAECTATNAALTTATTQLTELRELQTTLGDLDTQLSASAAAFDTVLTDGESFSGEVYSGITAYMVDWDASDIDTGATSRLYFRDPDRDQTGEADEGSVPPKLDSFNVSMRTGRQELATLNQRILSLTTARATIDSQVTTKEAEVATREADGEQCASEKRVLDADLAAAQVDLQLAEDAILAVCPDFDLDSIETT